MARLLLGRSQRAQQPTPVIGYLATGSAEVMTHRLAAFRKGLSETGYVEGYRIHENLRQRIPFIAQHRKVVEAGDNEARMIWEVACSERWKELAERAKEQGTDVRGITKPLHDVAVSQDENPTAPPVTEEGPKP